MTQTRATEKDLEKVMEAEAETRVTETGAEKRAIETEQRVTK